MSLLHSPRMMKMTPHHRKVLSYLCLKTLSLPSPFLPHLTLAFMSLMIVLACL